MRPYLIIVTMLIGVVGLTSIMLYLPLINGPAANPPLPMQRPSAAILTAAPASTAAPSDIPTDAPVPTATPPVVPAFSHVFVIVLENKEDNQIIGEPVAAYINTLASQYGRAMNFYGTRHPSLPNYLALLGGDTFGITSDCTRCFVHQTNLVDQLEAAGKSWKGYMESMPRPCFVGNAGGVYAQRHNPFIYFDNIRTDPARCNKLVPFDQFSTDLHNDTLPDFVWITPNLCHDMHDCSVRTGDTWLETWVPQILASPAWRDNGVLFITFDEGSSAAGCCTYAKGGKIDTLVISPLGKPGFQSDVAYDHYALLHTIEAAWGLAPLRKAACDCSPVMADFFQPTSP